MSYLHRSKARQCIIEAIRQALVLASEKAKITSHMQVDRPLQKSYEVYEVDKQSILDVEKLLV